MKGKIREEEPGEPEWKKESKEKFAPCPALRVRGERIDGDYNICRKITHPWISRCFTKEGEAHYAHFTGDDTEAKSCIASHFQIPVPKIRHQNPDSGT